MRPGRTPARPTASTAASRMEEGAEAEASSSLSGGPGDSGSDLAVVAVAVGVGCSCRSPTWNPALKRRQHKETARFLLLMNPTFIVHKYATQAQISPNIAQRQTALGLVV